MNIIYKWMVYSWTCHLQMVDVQLHVTCSWHHNAGTGWLGDDHLK